MGRRTIALLASLGVLALLALVALVRAPRDTLLWNGLFDAGHAPVFGIVALLLLAVLRRWLPGGPRPAYFWALAASVVLGVFSELLQFFAPRDSDPLDVARNVVGAVSFLALRASFDVSWLGTRFGRGSSRALLRILAFLLLGTVLLPVFDVGRAYAQRNRAFPVVCDFGDPWSKRFVHPVFASLRTVAPPPGWSVAELGAPARLVLHPAQFPRLQIEEPYPDWSGYERLRFPVYSPATSPQQLTVAVTDIPFRDTSANFYRQDLWIPPGLSRVELDLERVRTGPVGRETDMTGVLGIVLYADVEVEPIELLVGTLRLD